MFHELMDSNLVIREWLNGSLFPLSLNLAIIITVFLWDSFWEGRRRRLQWRHMPGVPTGCALWWLFSAESVRAGCVWYLLHIQNVGGKAPSWLEFWTSLLLVLTAASLIPTMLRCTFLFTPPRWGHLVWVASAILTALFLLLSHWLYPALT